jgi:hypothetical protein
MPDWLIKYLTWIFVFVVCIVPAVIGIFYLLKIILDSIF